MLQACVLTRAYTLPVSCGVLTVMLVALVIMCAFVLFCRHKYHKCLAFQAIYFPCATVPYAGDCA
jgi:uncharacterized membrane protein